jgi:hypothetical protein
VALFFWLSSAFAVTQNNSFNPENTVFYQVTAFAIAMLKPLYVKNLHFQKNRPLRGNNQINQIVK